MNIRKTLNLLLSFFLAFSTVVSDTAVSAEQSADTETDAEEVPVYEETPLPEVIEQETEEGPEVVNEEVQEEEPSPVPSETAEEENTADNEVQQSEEPEPAEELNGTESTEVSDIESPETAEELQSEPFEVQEDTTWQNDFNYTLSDGNIVISKGGNKSCYLGTQTEVVVPAQAVINGVTYTTLLGSKAFYQERTITSLTFEKGVRLPDNCWQMFESAYSLEYLDVSGLITDNVKNMDNMFSMCNKLTSIDVSNFNTGNVTTMKSMFGSCSKLTSIDISYFDLSNVTDMSYIFGGCSSLTSINTGRINTGNVTNMASMFGGCYNLPAIDVSGFDTSNVTNMSGMFGSCNKLTSIDVSEFNTSKVTNMNGMFSGCANLASVDVSGFDTSKVTDMSHMFDSCNNLSSIDISHFDTGSLKNMSYMFEDCTNLTSIDLSSFDTSDVTDMSFIFSDCNNLEAVDLSALDTGKVQNMNCMFTRCYSLTSIDVSNFNTASATTMHNMFANCSKLTSIDFGDFDTQNVTDMGYMFYGCKGLTVLDLSGFDTSHVKSMERMFQDCSNLTSVNLSGFNTGNVTNMSMMFNGCSNLTSIDFKSFNTQNVTDMNYMFSGCSNLTSLDLSGFDTSNVRSMMRLFQNCSSLTSVNLSGFNTAGITYMTDMFRDCSSLISLDLSSFNTENVTSMSYMFYGCSNLTSINLSSFNTGKVTSITSMFNGCRSLTSLDLSSFDTGNVTDMSYIFSNCSNLTSINLSSFNTGNVMDMGGMFSGCSNLTSIDLYNFDMSKVKSSGGMFSRISNLDKLYLPASFPGVKNTIDSYTFNESKVNNVYFGGSQEKWESLTVSSSDKDILSSAEMYFNYVPGSDIEPDPTETDWEYNDITYTMIIRGEGNMKDYTEEDVPWKDIRENVLSAVIGNDFESIGKNALRDITHLKRVYIPASVTEINENAFYNTPELQDVYYAGTQEQWEAIVTHGGNSSLSQATVHYQSPYDFATSWEFDPETSVLKISGSGPMTDLQDTSAPWYLFKDQITTIVIKEDITEIGAYTFKNITNLNRMYIPVSALRFNEYALDNDQLLLDIYYTGTEEQWGNIVTKAGNDVLFSDTLTVHYNSPYEETESEETIIQIKRDDAWYDAVKVKQTYYFGSDEKAELRVIPAAKYDNVSFIALKRGEETLTACFLNESNEGIITFVPGKDLAVGDRVKIVLCAIDTETIEEFDLAIEIVENSFTVSYYVLGELYKAFVYQSGNDIEKPEEPVREGWKFGGWYTNEKCTGISWFSPENSANRQNLSGDLDLYAKWVQFDPDVDAWGFGNSGNVFNGTDEPVKYEISTGDLNRLYDTVEASGNMAGWEDIREELRKDWNGSCYGMSVAAVLMYEKLLNISSFQPGAINVHDAVIPINTHAFADVSNVESMINFYYLRQYVGKYYQTFTDSLTMNENDRIQKIIEKMSAANGPCALSISLLTNGIDGSESAAEYHTVVAYEFEKVNDSNYKFKVYDCSLPGTVYEVELVNNGEGFTAECGVWEFDWITTGNRSGIDLIYAESADDLLTYGILTQPSVLSTAQSAESENQSYYELKTSYPSFSITDGIHTAVIKNCVKQSGDLELTILGNIKSINQPHVYAFRLPALEEGRYYTVNSDTYTSYMTTLTYHDSVREIYCCTETDDRGEVTFYTDGTVKTAFSEPVYQTVTVLSSEMNTPWYKVTAEGTSSGITAKPYADQVEVTSREETEMTISAGFAFSDLTIENVSVSDTAVQVKAGENDTCLIEQNGKTIASSTFGYSVIFDSMLGTPIAALKNVAKDSLLEKPADPTRDGYFFEGWYKDEQYTAKWDFDTDTIQKDTVL